MKLLEASVESKVLNFIFNGITASYGFLAILFLVNIQFEQGRTILLAMAFGIHIIRHAFKERNLPRNLFLILIIFVEYVMLIIAFMNTGTEIESTIFLLYTADVVLRYRFWFSIPFVYMGYALYLFLWTPQGYDVTFVFMSMLNQSILILPMWSAKVLLNQREQILKLNAKILEQSAQIEDLAKLKERNRIAEEVHDTVGHTLTTAIVALEGAHLLFDTRPEEAHEKVNIAKQQLKNSLGDIRYIVKKLRSSENGATSFSLEQSIKEIISNVEKQTHIMIAMDYVIKSKVISIQQHVIINAIKEGVTNVIKHGVADKIKLILESDDQQISITILDNGTPGKPIELGFGLTTMKARVEAIGGVFHYEWGNNGFVLMIKLPVVIGD